MYPRGSRYLQLEISRLVDDGRPKRIEPKYHVRPLVLAKLDHRSRSPAKGRDLSLQLTNIDCDRKKKRRERATSRGRKGIFLWKVQNLEILRVGEQRFRVTLVCDYRIYIYFFFSNLDSSSSNGFNIWIFLYKKKYHLSLLCCNIRE